MFGEEKFEKFNEWFSAQKRGLFPKDFLFWDGTGFHWMYMYEDGIFEFLQPNIKKPYL